MSDSVTQDFIFGTMATDDLRLAALRAAGQGLTHANRIVPLDPVPDQPVTLTVSAGPAINLASLTAFMTVDGTEPNEESTAIAFGLSEVVWDTLLWAYRQEWQAIIPAQSAGTLVRYQILGIDHTGGKHWADPDGRSGVPGIFAYHVDTDQIPGWLREAVIYHIFIDRFSPGAARAWQPNPDLGGFSGGTIRGVIETLPYLHRLGVTCLWLSPVFPSPTHHGYDATDYAHVEPRLGTDADLEELFAAAHALEIRVLLDFVASHVSNQHPAFLQARADVAAPERGWFTFELGKNGYRSFFDVPSMPQLNTDHPGARAYLIDHATDWLRRGADGFRLDYANGPSHAFWAAFRAATRAAKPESATLGEIVETAELQRSYSGRLDGTLDFLLLQQMRAFFAFETIDTGEFDSFLSRHLPYFGSDFVLPSFLDNHDMNRFTWVVQGDYRRLLLAALCQFTLPAPPIIYYGNEIGLNQARDLEYSDGRRRPEESRVIMPWDFDPDNAILAFYTRLIVVRRTHPDLWSGARTVHAMTNDGLYVVTIAGPTSTALVALNRTTASAHVHLPEGQDFTIALATDSSIDMAAGAVTLPALTGAVLISPTSA